MYNYEWDAQTGGYILTTKSDRFIANEIRPVFAEELELTGLSRFFKYDREEKRPYLWAQKNIYYYRGEKVAQFNGTQYGKPMDITCFFDEIKELEPVDIELMIKKNSEIMQAMVCDVKRRTKELYDQDIMRCDKAYIAFSGGKDSIVLLHICNEVLPLSVPVIFSDTDMELPDTYITWDEVQKEYPKRTFLRARAENKAVDNWNLFGPPSRTIRWCCSVHKSTPALIMLKKMVNKSSVRVMAFVGVRGEESISRSSYQDANEGVKNASQLNKMPILEWGAHELWLYIFQNRLYINRAYRYGLPRVGCAMCPESSEKYVWLVDAVYPGLIDSYADVIIKTGIKTFSTEEDKREYLAKQGWQARKSGVVLKDTITAPIENTEGLTVTFKSSFFDEQRFFTWIKPIGTVMKDPETGQLKLKLPHTLDEGIPFTYHAPFAGGGILTVHFRSDDERLSLTPVLRTMLKKVAACVNCRACEAECMYGALYYSDGKMQIDERKCVHCLKCFNNIDNGCWRYKSMYKSENEQKNQISSINRYNNFGIREKDSNLWISALVEMRDNFFPWNTAHQLGNKMVESANVWFQQSELIDNKSKTPTLLVDLFEKYGGDSEIGWEFIWIALANNAILIKWFITTTLIGETYNVDKLADMLKVDYPELGNSTIKGGLAALKDTISKSPVGGEGAMVQYEMKGKSVVTVTRLAKKIHPLTVLYGLYMDARLAASGTFTVAGLMDADIHSTYISPIAAFGIAAGEFKRICEGLHSRYPDYIATTFTHGNDEIRIFPDKFTTEDIIALAIQEG
ncbi:MAG TPA: phosphoadenosine phosphosulfate reductase family protein [Candidatus Eisenbergiella merdavium]|uniref:Phosphoadenosine phosphosulfate reductase family protein n=1 Tax=Candidatus Eisenbergiella merdavium TaxID=2838551 RepID=A0A9D2NI36_9FIRM|nr:phosphoadenosine phosphosulfate reductase family protein [Candidatus Eisenbergiella merdavium]